MKRPKLKDITNLGVMPKLLKILKKNMANTDTQNMPKRNSKSTTHTVFGELSFIIAQTSIFEG
uniref:Uncharacterized protein n=1 Tax=Rhizophora mucronata TaxID=61149 RepID=A0A2P2QUG3_RHIMU